MPKQCLECGGELAPTDRKCPDCGASQSSLLGRFLLGLVGLAMLGGLGFFGWNRYAHQRGEDAEIQAELAAEAKASGGGGNRSSSGAQSDFAPGDPVVTKPGTPVCSQRSLLSMYASFVARQDDMGASSLEHNGCRAGAEELTMTILSITPDGSVHAQLYDKGEVTQVWVGISGIRHYKTE